MQHGPVGINRLPDHRARAVPSSQPCQPVPRDLEGKRGPLGSSELLLPRFLTHPLRGQDLGWPGGRVTVVGHSIGSLGGERVALSCCMGGAGQSVFLTQSHPLSGPRFSTPHTAVVQLISQRHPNSKTGKGASPGFLASKMSKRRKNKDLAKKGRSPVQPICCPRRTPRLPKDTVIRKLII